MNIQKSHEKFMGESKLPIPIINNKDIINIGTLSLESQHIIFSMDSSYIFANNLAIADSGDNNISTADAFANALELAYEDKFVSDR